MDFYYVSKKTQSNGEREVHTRNCIYLPHSDSRSYLGFFSDCEQAVQEAKISYPKSRVCDYCRK